MPLLPPLSSYFAFMPDVLIRHYAAAAASMPPLVTPYFFATPLAAIFFAAATPCLFFRARRSAFRAVSIYAADVSLRPIFSPGAADAMPL